MLVLKDTTVSHSLVMLYIDLYPILPQDSEYAVMRYSGSGTVDGPLQLVNGKEDL